MQKFSAVETGGAAPFPDRRRRRVLQGGLAWLAAAWLPAGARAGLDFAALAPSRADEVRLAAGHRARLLLAWGDPVSAGPAFRADAGNSAAEQALQAGMHHDGMHYFALPDTPNEHGLLCINHEYTDEGLLHPPDAAGAERVAKSQAAVGVSVVEVRRRDGLWTVERPSRYARRITATTPLRIAGPAAGHALLRTGYDPHGRLAHGTLANCAGGATPWGTWLACEENFDGYFAASDDSALDAHHRRYDLTARGWGQRWHEHDARFDIAREPHEPHRYGWVVEIDPRRPDARGVKRTALGRFKHESATVTLARDGRVVVYMGDDEPFEYIYKFVSAARYDPARPDRALDLLDAGTLHVAHFAPDGVGHWIALAHGEHGLDARAGFPDQATVLVRARAAADRVGATPMDRPEWIAVPPDGGEVYCALTGNAQRGARGRPAAGGPNPRADNEFGHILRWREEGGDAAAAALRWEVFLLAGDPAGAGTYRGSQHGDAFAAPDGLWFDPLGRLWIATDVAVARLNRGAHAVFGNNQLLCADPVGGEVRRFLTGPVGCELTGMTGTPDGQTLFINIQHPGEPEDYISDPRRPGARSAWPANQFGGPAGRPRSATLAIEREGGGAIGT